jgi:uncharacterized protein YjbI with pentapeptide repeats
MSSLSVEQSLKVGQPVIFPPIQPGETDAQRTARTIPAQWITSLLDNADFTCALPVSVENAVIDGTIEQRGATFKQYVRFRSCEFTGKITLNFARFQRSLILEHCTFKGELALRGARVDGDLLLIGSSFTQATTFEDATVAQVLDASGAGFAKSLFERMTVGGTALFRVIRRGDAYIRTRFDGPARFLDIQVGHSAEFDGAFFGGETDFRRAHIKADALFRVAFHDNELQPIQGNLFSVEFRARADFRAVRVEGSAMFLGARFENEAAFNAIRVNGNVDFEPAVIQGTVYQTRFGGTAIFAQCQVDGAAWFTGVEFAGRATFEGARFGGVALFRLLEEGAPADREHVATFRSDVSFLDAEMPAIDCQGTEFHGKTNFTRLKVRGDADFGAWLTRDQKRLYTTRFRHRVSLRGAAVGGTLSLGSVDVGDEIDLSGLTYGRIDCEWRALFAKVQPFDRQPYDELEKYLRTTGDDSEAGRVYLARRWRESAILRRKLRRMSDETVGHWLVACVRLLPSVALDAFQRHVLRYGARPLRLLGASILVVALGWFLFAQPGAVVQADASARTIPVVLDRWQAFRYSLDLFVPALSLPVADDVVPSQELVPGGVLGLRYEGYAAMHTIAGWLLLPLGLAALTGLLLPRRDRGGTG